MNGELAPPPPVPAAHHHDADARAFAGAPQKGFLSSVTRSAIEKALITAISVLFGGATLYYLNAFKQNQDAMIQKMTAEYGPAWPKSTPDHVSIHDLWQTEEDLRKQVDSLKDSLKEQTQRSNDRINKIVQWGELLRTRMASWGTNEHYGKANLTNTDHVIYVNTRNFNGNLFKTGDQIFLTNRHHAQGPSVLGTITSAYPFEDEGPDANVLVQISRDIATQLKLPLTDGVFDISIRKAQAVPFVPGMEDGTKP